MVTNCKVAVEQDRDAVALFDCVFFSLMCPHQKY